VHDYVSAGRMKCTHNCSAYTPGAARDERGLAGEWL